MSEENRELNNENGASPFGEEPDPGKHQRVTDEIYTGQDFRASSEPEEEAREEKTAAMGKDIAILVMITLVAGLLLGVAYSVTKDPIARAQAQAKEEAQSAVMSMADRYETLYSSEEGGAQQIPEAVTNAMEDAGIGTTKVTQIDAALDKDGQLLGYVVTASDPDGYGGDVELMCGITPDKDGSVVIEGISFLSLSETAGMGMRAKDPEFADQFTGKEIAHGDALAYTKGGAEKDNEIDAISGCTITTSAVTDNVNAAVIAAEQLWGDGQAQPADEKSPDAAEADAGARSGTSETEQEASE